MILPDNETAVDLLNNEYIATTIKALLLERTGEPLTVGIHGDWGAGKSSVLQMLEKELEKDDDVLCIRFDSWRFQGFEDAKISLLEIIVTSLSERKGVLAKTGDTIKDLFKRIDWMKVAKHGGGLALTALTGIPTAEQLNLAVSAIKGLVADPAKLIEGAKIKSAMESAGGILKAPEDVKRIPTEIQEFRKAFDILLDQANIKLLVILVDDLDRCLPKTIIETLEAIRLFLFTKKTAFVIAADEGMIEYAVRAHFPGLAEVDKDLSYVRNYLEKLIQVPFKLPLLGENETKIYVSLLLIGAKVGDDDDPKYKKLIEVARKQLKTPWEKAGIDEAIIKSIYGSANPDITEMLDLSDRICPSLTHGTKGNPRQIKRFLNTLLLRQNIGEARGLGEDIKLPILAKLMIAERFIKDLFEHISSDIAVQSSGKCELLEQLENLDLGDQSKPSTNKKPVEEADKANGERNKLLSQEDVIDWSKIQPSLAKIDLRPYLLVSREDKPLFKTNDVSTHLTSLINGLLGSRLLISKYKADIEKLTSQDAEIVFEGLRTQIMISGDLSKAPDGTEGLKLLVANRSELQTKLVGFISSLPIKGLGGWAVGGWKACIKNPEDTEELNKIITGWSTQDENSSLRAVAGSMIKIPKG